MDMRREQLSASSGGYLAPHGIVDRQPRHQPRQEAILLRMARMAPPPNKHDKHDYMIKHPTHEHSLTVCPTQCSGNCGSHPSNRGRLPSDTPYHTVDCGSHPPKGGGFHRFST